MHLKWSVIAVIFMDTNILVESMQYSTYCSNTSTSKQSTINNARESRAVGNVLKTSCIQNHGRTYQQNAMQFMLHLWLKWTSYDWYSISAGPWIRYLLRSLCVSEPRTDTISSQRILGRKADYFSSRCTEFFLQIWYIRFVSMSDTVTLQEWVQNISNFLTDYEMFWN